MNRRATPKLSAFVAVTASAMFCGLLLGQVEVTIVGVPFVTALALGLARGKAPELEVTFGLSEEQCLEDDPVEAKITLQADGPVGVEVGLVIPPGFEAAAGGTTHTLQLEEFRQRTLPIPLKAKRWGAHPIGLVAVRAYDPGRLICYEHVYDRCVLAKVHPRFERLRRSVTPWETQVFSGDYVSGAAGDGIEFATVRPFVPGDSAKKVNWRVSTRRSTLHVNRAHPERNSDIVLWLDTFDDAGRPGKSSLDRTVLAATAIARHHLHHNDRVGLISFGGYLRWLTAASGRAHFYRVVDFVLDVEATFSYAWKNISSVPRRTLPPLATVVALTPLIDERALHTLTDLRLRGWPVVVIDTLDEVGIAPGTTSENRLAHRLWKLQRRMTKFELSSAGIQVVELDAAGALGAALARLHRGRRRRRAVT
jgi:uncharacterized protein (DUF58 family)